MQGIAKATGVAAKVPIRELNLSSLSPTIIHSTMQPPSMETLSKFTSHIFVLDFFIL
jgi:hypothetical protein